MGYLDIDTILAEEERLPCIFNSDAKGLAFLDQTITDHQDLPKGARIELPFWLGASLSEKRMVTVELPKHFGSRMRDEIMAGALTINLREFSYYFFEVGLKLCQITKDDDLQRSLRVAFCGDRYKSILVRSMSRYVIIPKLNYYIQVICFYFSSGHVDNAEYTQSLTAMELKIFLKGYQTTEEIFNWRTKKSFIIQKSNILRRKSSSNDEKSKKQKL